jgi:hypothetical protein
MTEQVRAICFPHDDEAFVTHVRSLIAPQAMPDARLRAAVEAALRESYPLAVISVRHPFAALDTRPTWYVYRDGGVAQAEAAADGATAVDR